MDGTSAFAEVPANPQALSAQPPIVPLPANEALTFLGVKPEIKDMTLEEKFACLKQCFTYGYGLRKVLCEVFESIRAEFKTYKKDRAGMPTVEEAFKQRGLDYKTVYSAIQREKDRRAEDAQFFAEINAEASTKNIHGLDVTDNDLPIGTKVVFGDGTKGQVLTAGEKTAPDAEPSFEVVTEEGTAVQVKRGDLVTLASLIEAKAQAKAAKEAAKNSPEAVAKETARIAAAAAKEDAALKSSDFYKEQYFQLLSLINAAPKEMTPTEFAQTVNDNLRVAYESLNAEEAKLIKPAPQFPVIRQGNESKLFTLLSEGRVDRKSMLDSVFGGIDEGSFLKHLRKFSQRICDKFHDGVYEVSVYSKNDRVVIDKAAYDELVAEVAALAVIANAWLQKKPDASTQDKTTVNGVLAGLPKQVPAPPLPASRLVVHSANYRAWQGGGNTYDVTEFLRNIIFGDSLVFDIENHNFVIGDHNFVPNDPFVGKVKRLRVTYSYKGDPAVTTERSEHDRLVLPEDSVIQRLASEIQQLKGAQPKPSQYPIPQLRAKVLVLCSELQGFLGEHGQEPKVERQLPEPPEAFQQRWRSSVPPWKAKFVGDYRLKFGDSVPRLRDEIRVRAGLDDAFLNAAIDRAANDPNANVKAVEEVIKRFWDMALGINA